MARVSICIPTYNQAQYLQKSAESACQQTYPDVEVWVSDDASTDETPELMAELCRQFPQIRYHRHSQNLGIAANNNWLLSQPETEFIVRLDSDDLLSPSYVESLLEQLSAYPKAAYAHAAVQEIDRYGKPSAADRPASDRAHPSRQRRHQAAPDQSGPTTDVATTTQPQRPTTVPTTVAPTTAPPTTTHGFNIPPPALSRLVCDGSSL